MNQVSLPAKSVYAGQGAAVPGPSEEPIAGQCAATRIEGWVSEAAEAIRNRWSRAPRVGLILGTGVGNIANYVQAEEVIPYPEIPHFTRSTAASHRGELVCGTLAGAPVITMRGRCHLYEGYSIDEITLPVRVMNRLGAGLLIASNASGGMNPQYASGDIMVMDEHINLMGPRANVTCFSRTKGRFVRAFKSPYDDQLIRQALSIARRGNFTAHRGVYVAMSGPNYETRAEYRMLRQMGADVVGMSTVPEAMVAASVGMRVLAMSIVTNVSTPDSQEVVQCDDVIAAAERAEPNLRRIVLEVLGSLED